MDIKCGEIISKLTFRILRIDSLHCGESGRESVVTGGTVETRQTVVLPLSSLWSSYTVRAMRTVEIVGLKKPAMVPTNSEIQ